MRTAARIAMSALAAVLMALEPGRAAACAVCIGSAFGDRGYTWPYIGLILMPFVVAAGIIGALAWQLGWRPRDVATRAATSLHAAWAAPWRRVAPGDPSPRTHTETT
jgi:hypothetical protein